MALLFEGVDSPGEWSLLEVDASDDLEDLRVMVWPAATASARFLASASSWAFPSFALRALAFLCTLFGA